MGSFTVWELLLYSSTDSFFSDLCVDCVLWQFDGSCFTSQKSSTNSTSSASIECIVCSVYGI